MSSEDGQVFIRHLAHFVQTHEKALADALQHKRTTSSHAIRPSTATTAASSNGGRRGSTASVYTLGSNTLTSSISMPSLNFVSPSLKPVKLSLTPHHLFYLLTRFEELNVSVGPMNVRLENIHTEASPGNYVSFLNQPQRRSKVRNSDCESVHSVSSVKSVMSGMSSLWSSFGLGGSSAISKSEKSQAALMEDLRYLYSACTVLPCLRLAPDRKARSIQGFEEFPFDTAVPLIAFKNVTSLEISDLDVRQFFGWDRLAEQLRSLTVKRAGVEDPEDLLINIVLDDMDRRRRRSSRSQPSPTFQWPVPQVSQPGGERERANSAPGSPNRTDKMGQSASPKSVTMVRGASEGSRPGSRHENHSRSPPRPASGRLGSSHGHVKTGAPRIRRSESTSSHSSSYSNPRHAGSSPNLLYTGQLPSSKWMFLRHLSLADNSLTSISATSLAPLANVLTSLDLSSNLFTQVPDSLATLTSLRSLSLANCMIDSLHSLTRSPLPAIATLNLRANRLMSLAGIERLFSLERVDLRENRLTDPVEIARLTGMPDMHEMWVAANPFTRTHSSYRITIFNLFRNVPGYSEDVLLDSSGPGYYERKWLIERVAEGQGVPVVKTAPAGDTDSPAVHANGHTSSGRASLDYAPHINEKAVGVGSQRRKRAGARRRMVELSNADAPPISTFTIPNSNNISGAGSPRRRDSRETSQASPTSPPPPSRLLSSQTISTSILPPAPPRLDTSIATPSTKSSMAVPTLHTLPPRDPQEWNRNSEAYRKKIETLRSEVGSGWLSVLNEESGGHSNINASTPNFSPASTIRPSPATPRAGQVITGGGRTLG